MSLWMRKKSIDWILSAGKLDFQLTKLRSLKKSFQRVPFFIFYKCNCSFFSFPFFDFICSGIGAFFQSFWGLCSVKIFFSAFIRKSQKKNVNLKCSSGVHKGARKYVAPRAKARRKVKF